MLTKPLNDPQNFASFCNGLRQNSSLPRSSSCIMGMTRKFGLWGGQYMVDLNQEILRYSSLQGIKNQ